MKHVEVNVYLKCKMLPYELFFILNEYIHVYMLLECLGIFMIYVQLISEIIIISQIKIFIFFICLYVCIVLLILLYFLSYFCSFYSLSDLISFYSFLI